MSETRTLTLTDFLLARIAEDEAAAQLTYETCFVGTLDPKVKGSRYDLALRMSPARVLAECEAKRRIVALHPVYRGPRLLEVGSPAIDFGCERCHAASAIDSKSVIEALGWCDTLRVLASVYADHPDYREEWKP